MRSAAAAEADYEIAKHLEMEPVKKQKTMHALSTLCKIRHNEALSQIAVLHEYSEPGQTKECSRNATTFNSMVPLPCSLSIQASEAMKQFEGFSRLTLHKLLTNNGRLSLGLILFHSVEPNARASLVDNHLGVAAGGTEDLERSLEALLFHSMRRTPMFGDQLMWATLGLGIPINMVIRDGSSMSVLRQTRVAAAEELYVLCSSSSLDITNGISPQQTEWPHNPLSRMLGAHVETSAMVFRHLVCMYLDDSIQEPDEHLGAQLTKSAAEDANLLPRNGRSDAEYETCLAIFRDRALINFSAALRHVPFEFAMQIVSRPAYDPQPRCTAWISYYVNASCRINEFNTAVVETMRCLSRLLLVCKNPNNVKLILENHILRAAASRVVWRPHAELEDLSVSSPWPYRPGISEKFRTILEDLKFMKDRWVRLSGCPCIETIDINYKQGNLESFYLSQTDSRRSTRMVPPDSLRCHTMHIFHPFFCESAYRCSRLCYPGSQKCSDCARNECTCQVCSHHGANRIEYQTQIAKILSSPTIQAQPLSNAASSLFSSFQFPRTYVPDSMAVAILRSTGDSPILDSPGQEVTWQTMLSLIKDMCIRGSDQPGWRHGCVVQTILECFGMSSHRFMSPRVAMDRFIAIFQIPAGSLLKSLRAVRGGASFFELVACLQLLSEHSGKTFHIEVQHNNQTQCLWIPGPVLSISKSSTITKLNASGYLDPCICCLLLCCNGDTSHLSFRGTSVRPS
jgi:hypothetical protein